MIDIHCHILPLADDGSSSMEESIAMARHAVSDGIHTIVATPHALGGTFPNPPEKIKIAVKDLQAHINSKDIPLSIYPGSEVHLCSNMAKRILNDEASFLSENRRYILVEFPFRKVPQCYRDELYHLRLNEIVPVIAHPERNPLIFRDKEILYDIIKMGCRVQLNSTSVTGGFGEKVMICAHDLIRLRLAHIIASDAHSAYHRPPVISDAAKIAEHILGDAAEADIMVNERSEKIISGDSIEITDPIHFDKK